MNRSEFGRFIRDVAINPTENNIASLQDDTGYLEILVQLAVMNPDLNEFHDSEPIFLAGKINWPKALVDRNSSLANSLTKETAKPKSPHPAWMTIRSINDIPDGKWLLRADQCGWPAIFVVKITASPGRPGRKTIWHGAGGSEKNDPAWVGWKFTHYAPFSAFAEVSEDIK